MTMERTDLIGALHKAFRTVYEGEKAARDTNVYPYAVYWDYVWEDISASGEAYEDLNTYQVSMFDRIPPRESPEIMMFRKILRDEFGEHIAFYHEYYQEKTCWHTYCAIQIAETLSNGNA